jgi:cytochrome b6-f complex iron-sulfur subunit
MKLLVTLTTLLATGNTASAFVSTTSMMRPSYAIIALKASEIVNENDSATYIDQERRNLMNWILVGSASATVGGLAVPYLSFFVPPVPSNSGGAIPAKDALGHDVSAKDHLASHPAGDHSLVQGLKGDATYLIIDKDTADIQDFALNAICTHLGCVVPWSVADNKFMCPCHGSQYNPDGGVVRGPAPLPLALAHVSVENDNVMLTPWTELDFRTNEKAWWN